LLIIQHCLLIL